MSQQTVATTPTIKYTLNDIRTLKDFTTQTFSGYKKTAVTKSLCDALCAGKIEHALNWCAELISSGFFQEIWTIFIQFYCKYVHMGNIKIAVYLQHKYKQFEGLMDFEYKHITLQMRNDARVRKMFAEIICVLIEAPRKHIMGSIKIVQDDFDMNYMKTRFNAPNTSYAEAIFQEYDPSEFIVAINEFAYHISEESKNAIKATYWIEWIFAFDEKSKHTTPEPIVYECELRDFVTVEHKYKKEVYWIIWDALFVEIDSRIEDGGGPGSPSPNLLIKKALHALFYLYSLHYSKAAAKRRRNILYFAVNLLCEVADTTVELIPHIQKQKVATIIGAIDNIYKPIKSNEIGGGVDYLFSDVM